jgi:uncharacterized protein
MLKDNIQKKIIESLKAGNKTSVKVLRFILSEIKYAEINKKNDLNDEETVTLIRKELKKRKEAVEMFKKAKRDDLVEDEENQIKIIEGYLPKNMESSDLRKIVKETLLSTPDKSNTGRIIGAVMGKVKGQADGAEVARIVKEELANKQ